MQVGGQRHAQAALSLTNQTFILTKLHGATSQQTLTFTFTSVETTCVINLMRFIRKYTVTASQWFLQYISAVL
jgi:hypothetical protein